MAEPKPEPKSEPRSELAELRQSIDTTRQSMDDAVKKLSKRDDRQRWAIGAAVAFTLALGGGALRVAQLAADQDASRDAQCSLYGLILRGDTPERRAAMPPDELATYEHAIDVIRHDAESLDCPPVPQEPNP